jgi:leucyl/phenylalanyl-tRNA---protein transferase
MLILAIKKTNPVGFAMSVESELTKIFSNPHAETLEGVLAVGGQMSVELLAYAYDHGVFPWPHEGYPLLWFCPDERGVIDFAELRTPRSFKKWLKKKHGTFTITLNQKFADVVRACKTQKRRGQAGTWINQEIEKNYLELHSLGKAFSLEVMRGNKLVGGIYGVQSQRYFSCESMFHKEDNVSKLALYEMVQHLQSLGQTWMDIQMVTEVCESFGGKLITKSEFLKRIGV